MNRKNLKNPKLRLSKRDLDILIHLKVERMITTEIMHRRFFPGQSIDAVKSTRRRLCGKPPEYRLIRPEALDAAAQVNV